MHMYNHAYTAYTQIWKFMIKIQSAQEVSPRLLLHF